MCVCARACVCIARGQVVRSVCACVCIVSMVCVCVLRACGLLWVGVCALYLWGVFVLRAVVLVCTL